MATNQFIIEKLNLKNFARWARDIKFLLIEKNAFNIVIGKEIRPVKIKEDDKIKEAAIKYWDMRERMAMTVIYLNAETGLKFIIKNSNSSIEAWKTLNRHFRPHILSHQISTFSDFQACHILPDEDIDLFSA